MDFSRRHSLITFGSLAALAGSVHADARRATTQVSQEGGAVARSPDGQSFVRTMGGDETKQDNDPRSDASLWLHWRGALPRLLTHYDRSGSVVWTPDSRRIVFLAEGVEDMQLYIFERQSSAATALEADRRLRALMDAATPNMRVENHLIRILRIGRSGMSVDVTESGLPPGRANGSFVGRHQNFEITFAPLNVS